MRGLNGSNARSVLSEPFSQAESQATAPSAVIQIPVSYFPDNRGGIFEARGCLVQKRLMSKLGRKGKTHPLTLFLFPLN